MMENAEMTRKDKLNIGWLQNMRIGAILFNIIVIWTWAAGTEIDGAMMFGMLATGIATAVGVEFSLAKLRRKYE